MKGNSGNCTDYYFLTLVLVHVVVSFLPFSSTPDVFITVVPVSGLVCVMVVSVTRGFELEHPGPIVEIIATNITTYERAFHCKPTIDRNLSFVKFRRSFR